MNRIENNAPWLAGYHAGVMGQAYDVSHYAYEIQRAAYQRGYNAGCEDLIETQREASTVWREER